MPPLRPACDLGIGGLLLLTVLAGVGTARAEPLELGALQELLCTGREPCHLVSSQEAGIDEGGQTLLVVQLALHDEDLDNPEASKERCLPHEYWLIMSHAHQIASRQLLLVLCSDGASSLGTPQNGVTIGANRFSVVDHARTDWHWTSERTLQLSPLLLLSDFRDGAAVRDGESNFLRSHWSWEEFKGRVEWRRPWCEENTPPTNKRTEAFRYLPIPLLKPGSDLLGQGWPTRALGSCAVQLDSSGKQGFIIQGVPTEEDDAELRAVLLTPRVLLVELRDDRWVPVRERGAGAPVAEGVSNRRTVDNPPQTPSAVDALHLWLGPQWPASGCLPREPFPLEWIIPVGDVRPVAGSGNPTQAPTVERQEVVVRKGRTVVRLKVQLPTPVEAITLAYADSDDGRTVERILATSALQPGVWPSLGLPLKLDPGQAVCEIRREALMHRLVRFAPSTAPLLGSP